MGQERHLGDPRYKILRALIALLSGGSAPVLPFTVIATASNVTVGAFGSIAIGPFAFAAGTAVEFVVTATDLDGGSRATWGGFADGEITYQQTDSAAGTVSFRIENTSGGDKHVNYRAIQWN